MPPIFMTHPTGMEKPAQLRLGTRGSLLARTQSGQVAEALRDAHPGLQVDLITISTSGDRFSDVPLADAGGKGLFTKELEIALLEKRIDLAVHSFKDVPVTMPLVDQADLIIGSVPKRQDPRDVLVSRKASSLGELPAGAKIGTGSLRRKCQILELRPDLSVVPMRGNVDTRISKLERGDCDAIVLALAGLKRLGKFDPAWMYPIDTGTLLPAAAQGALALQCRRDDGATAAIISVLNDRDSFDAVAAEREVVLALNGDCHSPIAALALINGENLSLSVAVGQRDGLPPVKKSSATAPRGQWKNTVNKVCESLK
jgi:hydroxymethylbilane synthase